MNNLIQLLLAVILTVFPLTIYGKSDTAAGTVHILKGRATATTPDGNIRSIRKGSKVYSSEIISTASGSYSRLKLKDNTWIMLRPDSRFFIEKVEFKEKTKEGSGFFALLKGGFRAVSGFIKKKRNYRFNTLVATIGIRGTSFMVRICNDDCLDIDPPPKNGLYLEVLDNTVVLSNNAAETSYTAGQYAYIANDSSKPEQLTERPSVFVQSPIPVADPADCLQ